MRWSIDEMSGSCFHPSGLSAYIDVDESTSIIRCLGPFGPAGLSEMAVRKSSALLTKQLEAQDSGLFVVWGSYSESPEFLEHRFAILGSHCGFQPNLSYRAELASQLECLDLKSEWRIEYASDRHIHFSGAVLDSVSRTLDASSVSASVLHPLTAETILSQLAELELFRLGKQSNPRIHAKFNELTWNEALQSNFVTS